MFNDGQKGAHAMTTFELVQLVRASSVCAMLTVTFSLLSPSVGNATEPDAASGYLFMQRWIFEADTMANESVTHEMCGWGSIDMRTPFMMDVVRHVTDPLAWDELAKRFDNTVRERRQQEAVLTAHGANEPTQRMTGLHPTGGCSGSVRERIERRLRSAMVSVTTQHPE